MGLINWLGKGHVYSVGASDVVINARNSTRAGMRLAGVATIGGGYVAGAAITSPDDLKAGLRDPMAIVMNPAADTIMGVGTLLGATSIFVKPQLAQVLKGGFASRLEAIRAADDFNRAVGVTHNGQKDGWTVLDLERHYDLDNIALEDLRVGNGSIKFDSLVTRDGDLLSPLSTKRGWMNEGAMNRLSLLDLDPGDGVAVENALRGRQIGTSDQHTPTVIGPMIGRRTGYETERAVADDIQTANGPDILAVRVGKDAGARWFGFRADGPPMWQLQARGTAVAPFENVMIGSDKAMWRASEPADVFRFDQRVLPFDPQDPIGKGVTVDGVRRTPEQYIDSFRNRRDALREAERLGARDMRGRYVGDGFMSLEAEAPGGGYNYHVYLQSSTDGSHGRAWNRNLGEGQSVQYDYSRTRTERQQGYRGHHDVDYRRNELWQRENNGRDEWVADGGWYETGRRWYPDPEPRRH